MGLDSLYGVFLLFFFNYNLTNMKKKFIIYIYSVIIVILLSCFFLSKEIIKKNNVEAKITSIPEMLFIEINNNIFSNRNIDQNKSRIIINHFSPTCEHCQYMASEYIKDSQKLKDIQILMITSADSLATSKFYNDYKLSLLSNIVILRDTDYQFQKTFETSIVPSFFIYEHNKLVKKVIGETKIENLTN